MFEAAGPAIDIFFIGNDFGSQTGPLLGVDLFDRFAMPSLQRLIDLGHRFGKKVMMHCCGGFRPLIPSLIRAGLDGVHALQPSCTGMEPASLKRDFGDRMLLNGAVDSHHVLIDGTPDFVREQTRKVLGIMAPGGGYVAGASHDYILEETPLENVLAMFDTIREYVPRHAVVGQEELTCCTIRAAIPRPRRSGRSVSARRRRTPCVRSWRSLPRLPPCRSTRKRRACGGSSTTCSPCARWCGSTRSPGTR